MVVTFLNLPRWSQFAKTEQTFSLKLSSYKIISDKNKMKFNSVSQKVKNVVKRNP